MGRLTKRDAVAIILVALACGIVSVLPPFDFIHRWSIDALTALRWEAFGSRRDPATTSVAVIAIDEETNQTPPFKGSPIITWTTEVGRVLNAVIDGGARVAGFDIVFSRSIEQSEIPFGEDLLGARMRGFDRAFLRSLARDAAAGKVVLGEVLLGDGPSLGQRIAVGRQKNIRALNVVSDPDEVIRKIPLTFLADGKRVPSMALELASRALGVEPVLAEDGSVTLAGYRIPSAVPNTMTLNFEGGGDDIPTFSFADLRACVERNDTEFFRRQFAGKIVIFGTLLGSEDRKVTSKRFATGLDGSRAPRCALPAPPPVAGQFKRSTIAGVYVHATAVQNLIARNAVVEPGRLPTAIIAIVFAVLAALAARMLTPGVAALAYVAMASIWTAGATLAFMRSLALPLSEPLLAGIVSMAAIVAYRLVITDKGERLLRKSFALYLAPQVIDRMLASKKLPELGGETRDVTVFFSDLEGFSSISEKLAPAELVALMNEYLSAMTDIIEANGGYVDKYIGDSIVAVFGAPADDSDHAGNAARAALGCRARLDELNRDSPAFQGYKIAHRMGLNSGPALVGKAFQLLGHERCGERGVATRGRQQILRHHDRRLGNDGRAHGIDICVARTGRHPGPGTLHSGKDLRAARGGRAGDAATGGVCRDLCRGARTLAKPRVRRRRKMLSAGRRCRQAVCVVSHPGKRIRQPSAGFGLGTGQHTRCKVDAWRSGP